MVSVLPRIAYTTITRSIPTASEGKLLKVLKEPQSWVQARQGGAVYSNCGSSSEASENAHDKPPRKRHHKAFTAAATMQSISYQMLTMAALLLVGMVLNCQVAIRLLYLFHRSGARHPEDAVGVTVNRSREPAVESPVEKGQRDCKQNKPDHDLVFSQNW